MKTGNNVQKTGNRKMKNPLSVFNRLVLGVVFVGLVISAGSFGRQVSLNSACSSVIREDAKMKKRSERKTSGDFEPWMAGHLFWSRNVI